MAAVGVLALVVRVVGHVCAHVLVDVHVRVGLAGPRDEVDHEAPDLDRVPCLQPLPDLHVGLRTLVLFTLGARCNCQLPQHPRRLVGLRRAQALGLGRRVLERGREGRERFHLPLRARKEHLPERPQRRGEQELEHEHEEGHEEGQRRRAGADHPLACADGGEAGHVGDERRPALDAAMPPLLLHLHRDPHRRALPIGGIAVGLTLQTPRHAG
mmetsp:Transcript_47588/g.134023  ORF Transcript_47588/g.134023 Transcript_47588/m.134023 type:complete len:213 (-) Transcript_47588:274-912(-)